MVASLSVVQWTLVGVLLTALFTGLAAVIAWRIYGHGRTVVGHRRPVRVSRALPEEGSLIGPGLPRETGEFARYAPIYVFNRAGIQVTATIDTRRTRVIWPRLSDQPLALTNALDLGPHDGGNHWIGLVAVSREAWPKDEPNPRTGLSKRRYWLRFVAWTPNRRRVWKLLPIPVHIRPIQADLVGAGVLPSRLDLPRKKPPRDDSEATEHRDRIVHLVQSIGETDGVADALEMGRREEFTSLCSHLADTDAWVEDLQQVCVKAKRAQTQRNRIRIAFRNHIAEVHPEGGVRTQDILADTLLRSAFHGSPLPAGLSEWQEFVDQQKDGRPIDDLRQLDADVWYDWKRVLGFRPSSDVLRQMLRDTECPGCPR